jgi:sporulation protein YlmC with PRC-barrel domain
MASINDPTDTGGHAIAASQVNGTNVYDMAGEKLGSVYDVILDKASGRAEYAILSFGGFLGIGDKYHPLPWTQMAYDTGLGGYVVNIDRRRLEGAPAYAASEMTAWDDLRGRDIDAYYGTSLR